MSENEIVAAKSRLTKPVAAVAKLFPYYLKDLELKVVPEESKYKWHADVIDWPHAGDARNDLIALKLMHKIGKVEEY